MASDAPRFLHGAWARLPNVEALMKISFVLAKCGKVVNFRSVKIQKRTNRTRAAETRKIRKYGNLENYQITRN